MKPKQLTPAVLKKFRQHYAWTQEQTAEALGVSRITYNRWERGQAPIPLHLYYTLRGLIAALNDQNKEAKQ